MSPTFRKELRIAWLPLAIASTAAFVCGGYYVNDPVAHVFGPSDIVRHAAEWCPGIFCFNLAIFAGLVFGSEYQHRTMLLLLTQPKPRSRMWNEKSAMLAGCALLIALVWLMGSRLGLKYHWGPGFYSEGEATSIDDILLSFAAFALATLCSAGYWSMIARSVIGGIVLTGGFQLLAGLGVALIAEKVFKAHDAWRVVICLSPVYALIFVFLGRRKFMHLQVTAPLGTENNRTDFLAALRLEIPWLRVTRRSAFLNLIRKEVLLNKPLFVISAFYVASWAIGSLVFKASQADKTTADSITVGITAVYICTIFGFTGSVSLGEKKSMGMHASQLTLPVRKAKLWGAKLLVAALLCVALGVLLPALVVNDPLQAAKEDPEGMALIVFGCFALTLIGFWSATHFQNSVTAVLVTVLFLPGMALAATVGDFLVKDYLGFQAPLLEWMCLHFHLSPDYFASHSDPIVFVLLPAIICAVLLRQSIIQFSTVQQSRASVVRRGALIFLLTIFFSAWINDFNISNNRLRSGMVLQEETEQALRRAVPKTPAAGALDDVHEAELPLNELIGTGELPKASAEWLRGSKISVRRTTYHEPRETPQQGYFIGVVFPHETNCPWFPHVFVPARNEK